MGEGFALLLSELRTEAAADAGAAAAALGSACDTLEAALAKVLSMTAGDPEFPYRAAGDFLQLCATVLQAFAWARSARCIQALPVGRRSAGKSRKALGSSSATCCPTSTGRWRPSTRPPRRCHSLPNRSETHVRGRHEHRLRLACRGAVAHAAVRRTQVRAAFDYRHRHAGVCRVEAVTQGRA